MRTGTIRPIVELTIDNKYIRTIDHMHIMNSLGYKYIGVYNCITGKRKTYKGHKFILEKEYDKSELEDYNYILCIDENKNIIKKYKKLIDVEVDLFQFPLVSKCLNHKRVSHGGYIWLYQNELHLLDDKIKQLNKILNNEHLKRNKVHQYKGNKLVNTYDSVTDAAKHGFTRTCISKCLRGEQKTHLGYTFTY